MRDQGRPPRYPLSPDWVRYAFAVFFVVIGWLGRWMLTDSIGPTARPLILFFPAIAATAWLGGWGPGLLATILSTLASNYFFIEPIHTLKIHSFADLVSLVIFVGSCAIIIIAFESMHRANRRLALEAMARKHAHADAARARDLLSTTLASIGDGVIVTDAAGIITFLNAEAERLTRWTSADAAGKPLPSVFRIINEISRETVQDPVEKVIREGNVVGLANHTILIAKDGTEAPIDDSAAPVREPDGPLLGVVLVFRDVTVQRKAEEAQARLAAIVKYSGDAIFTKSLEGIIQTWNASAERLFGYSADEIIGKPITTLIPPERLEEETQILARLRRGEPSERLETIRIAKNGRRIPVHLSVSPLKDADGRVVGASKIIHDVTEMVAAREALHREKELLATTLASIGDGVIVTDANGRLTFLNAEAERLTGWNLVDARGRDLATVFRIVNEQSRLPAEDPVKKVLSHGIAAGLANHTILIARGGEELPIDDSAAPIRDRSGRIVGVVLVFRDVTERRRAERILRETSQRKDNFLAILSHELRNPLAPIRMAASLLRKIGPPDPELQELRDVIDRQAAQLARLLDDLLDVSRISSGKIILRKERASLGMAVNSALEAARPLMDAQRHHLSVQMPSTPIYVEGDLTRLSQIVTNVLNNAAKYTPRGGRIDLTLLQEGSDAVIKVRDNGIGIAPDQLSNIFEMFVQIENSLERTHGGLGVGLSLVRRLVEMHDGSVTARSEGIGKGTEIVIRLPALLAAPPDPSAMPEETGESRDRKSMRILIADDNTDSAQVLARILKMRGHDIHLAPDGAAAVRLFRDTNPDVAILDIGMPNLNGYEVARQIRAEGGNRTTLVAITGWGQDDDKRRAVEAGFDHHLTKPVDPIVLDRLLTRIDSSSDSIV